MENLKILLESDNKVIYQVANKTYYLNLNCEVFVDILFTKYQPICFGHDPFYYPANEWEDLNDEEKAELVGDAHEVYEEKLEMEDGESFVKNVSELVKLLNENGYTFSLKSLFDFYNRHLLIHDNQGAKDSVELYPTTIGIQIKHNYNTTILAHTTEFVLSYLKNNFTPLSYK